MADASRTNTGPLAAVEKKTLIWLAERMPAWVNSDHLTSLGLLSMLCVGLSYWYARENEIGLALAVVFLTLNWLGDSLDGTLARVRGRLRPRYGFYVDHVCDCFGATFLLVGLGLSGYMSMFIALPLLVVYLLISCETYLATYSLRTFKMSHFGFGPTELRILLALGTVWVWFWPEALIGGTFYRVFDLGGAVAIAALTVVVIRSTIRNTIRLYREERLP